MSNGLGYGSGYFTSSSWNYQIQYSKTNRIWPYRGVTMVAAEAKSRTEGSPHSWGWIDFLEHQTCERELGDVQSFRDRSSRLPAPDTVDIKACS